MEINFRKKFFSLILRKSLEDFRGTKKLMKVFCVWELKLNYTIIIPTEINFRIKFFPWYLGNEIKISDY